MDNMFDMIGQDRVAKGLYWSKSWNPIKLKEGGYGCTKISPGCQHCWAEAYTHHWHHAPFYDNRKREFVLDEKVLTAPLRARKPRVYFVCDLMDLFHKDVPQEFIDQAVAVMGLCKQHLFLILTKRAERMATYMNSCARYGFINESAHRLAGHNGFALLPTQAHGMVPGGLPFPNIWLGVTAENQEQADKRIPILLQIPAAVRWVSIEPMLGAVDMSTWLCKDMTGVSVTGEKVSFRCGIRWVVCGGETSWGARCMEPTWALNVWRQCISASIPFFFKQEGNVLAKDHTSRPDGWKSMLSTRQYPMSADK